MRGQCFGKSSRSRSAQAKACQASHPDPGRQGLLLSIPSGGSFCERRTLLFRDPFGLLGKPKPFPPKFVIARPYSWVARFMSSLQRKGGLFAIPLRSRQHGSVEHRKSLQHEGGPSRGSNQPGPRIPRGEGATLLFIGRALIIGLTALSSCAAFWWGGQRWHSRSRVLSDLQEASMGANSGEAWSEMDLVPRLRQNVRGHGELPVQG